jgi:hypothetical protein
VENYFIYNDPIRIVWRKGNAEEPYVDKVESQKVINNMVVLTEIPDEFTHVSISGLTEIYEGTPSTNQFIVNYENGIITFHPSKEGTTITNMTYKGRGFILYPASRIYGRNGNPDVTVTLQEIIDAGQEALEGIRQLLITIANSEAATAEAITQAAYAKTQGDYAKAQGDYAKASGDALVFKGTYATSTAYVARNMVYYNGATYMSILASTNIVPTNTTYWKKIGSMVWKGTYSTATTYTYGDFVTDANNYNLYMSISETNTNQLLTNTSYWNKMISVQSVVDATITATTNANTATTQANAARDAANTAKQNADAATALANTATSQANTARDAANTATTNANTARDSANASAANADTKATYAQNQGDYAKNVGDSLVHKGDYNASTVYAIRNMVYYNGCTYMCILATTAGIAPTNTTYWRKIVAFNWKGTYSNGTVYQYGDFIVDTTGQKMYVCIKDGTVNIALSTVANWSPIIDISAIITSATTATTNANTATTQANTARDNANTATTNANTATTQANAARDAANLAKTNADTAASNANDKADYAQTQGDYAKAQGDAAKTATTQANAARDAANLAKTNADTATTNANLAKDAANTAASAANTAKQNADTATSNANTATTNANTARDAANTAATNANTVASRTSAKGTYNASTTYYPNNIVTYNGSSYMCIAQALNKVPTDTGFWQLIAQKGNDGLGSVVGLTSANSDIIIAGTVQNPDLSLNASLKALWNDKYTKSEVDTLISQATSSIQWKASVANYAAIATTYPNPQDGWTVNVNDTDYTYRYTGSAWVAISANAIPNASASTDGKMSIADFNKLSAISAQANKTTASGTNGNILIDGVQTVVYTHPTGAGNNHIPTGGAVNNFLKYSASGVAVWATPTLVGLSDTTITSPSSNQVLRFNGTSWVNSTLTFSEIGNGSGTGVLITNLNADMVDGYHLDQDVRTTAAPKFWGMTVGGGSGSTFLLDQTNLNYALPTQGTGGYARGFYFQNYDRSASYGGFGMYGNSTSGAVTINNLYMAHGDSPWANGLGIYVLPNGFTGIKKLNPIYELDVYGYVGATKFVSNVATGTSPLQVSSTTRVDNLNADMLDGVHGSNYMRAEMVTATENVNNLVTSGVYRMQASGMSNLPGTGYYYGQTLVLRAPSSDTIAQVIFPYIKANGPMYRRGNPTEAGGSGTYSSWYKIWTEENMGTGGGLDADMVDGYHFNQALLSTSSPNFVSMGLTGALYMSSVAPVIELNETDQGTNEKKWWIVPDAKKFEIRTITDGGGTGSTALSIERTGTTISGMSLSATNITLSSNKATIQNANDAILYLYSTGSAANAKQGYVSFQSGMLKLGTALDSGAGTNHIIIGTDGLTTFTRASGAPFAVSSTTVVTNLNADMVDGYQFNQDLRTTAAPTFAGIEAAGTSYIGGLPGTGNATIRITGTTTGAYLQGSNNARTASAPLWLTGLNGTSGEIRTYNNVLDDGIGNTTILTKITSPIFKSGNYSIQYNATEDSLDFIYG